MEKKNIGLGDSFSHIATKGKNYICLHKLNASSSCIFVQLNLAFTFCLRYTVAIRSRAKVFLELPEIRNDSGK